MRKEQHIIKPAIRKWQPFLIALLILLPLLYLMYWNAVIKYKEPLATKKKAVTLIQQNNFNNTPALQAIIDKTINNPSENNFLDLSVAYYNLGMYNECISASQKAIKFNPCSAVAYNNIGTAYNQMGQYSEAKKNCKKALELDPDFTLAKNNLKVAINGMQ